MVVRLVGIFAVTLHIRLQSVGQKYYILPNICCILIFYIVNSTFSQV